MSRKELIKQDWHNLKHIEQTHNICHYAININPMSLQYIKPEFINQSLIIKAIKLNWKVISLVKNLTKEIIDVFAYYHNINKSNIKHFIQNENNCKLLFQYSRKTIEYFDKEFITHDMYISLIENSEANILEKICLPKQYHEYAVQKSVRLITLTDKSYDMLKLAQVSSAASMYYIKNYIDVLPENQKNELYDLAIVSNQIEHIPDEYKTKERVLKCLESNIKAIRYFPETLYKQEPDLYLTWAFRFIDKEQNRYCLSTLPFHTKELITAAINADYNNIFNIKLPHYTIDYLDLVLDKYPEVWQNIDIDDFNDFKGLSIAEVEQQYYYKFPKIFIYIDSKSQTKEMCLHAVQYNPANYYYCRYKSKKITLEALKLPSNISYVKTEYKEYYYKIIKIDTIYIRYTKLYKNLDYKSIIRKLLESNDKIKVELGLNLYFNK
jgi:hypothetical protein